MPEERPQGVRRHARLYGRPTVRLRSPETRLDGGGEGDGIPWHAGVLQGAERFMTSWHKDEEEASRQRATKRGGNGLKNSLDTTQTNWTEGGRVETAQEECEREEADRVARYVVD